MKRGIDELTQFISQHFLFNEAHYPELRNANDEQRLVFAIKHSALRLAKTAGKISAVAEDIDHGTKPNLDELRTNIPKALINTLRLAELVGMSEVDIIKAIEKKYGASVDEN